MLMTDPNIIKRESSRIIKVGSAPLIHQDAPWITKYETAVTLCGLPGQKSGEVERYPAYCFLDVQLQFVIDEDNLVWCRVYIYNFEQDKIDPAEYPMMFVICREPFVWLENESGASPSSGWAFRLVDDFTVLVTEKREYRKNYNRGVPPITKEDAEKGITVSDAEGWVAVGYTSELDIRGDGTHIWFSACGIYPVTNPAYPEIHEHVFNTEEIPFDYYPCSMYNTTDNKFISCDNAGHSFTMFDGSSFRDVKNFEHDSAGDSKGFMYYNDNWNKIAKG